LSSEGHLSVYPEGEVGGGTVSSADAREPLLGYQYDKFWYCGHFKEQQELNECLTRQRSVGSLEKRQL
jgi:hypothetical protein